MGQSYTFHINHSVNVSYLFARVRRLFWILRSEHFRPLFECFRAFCLSVFMIPASFCSLDRGMCVLPILLDECSGIIYIMR